LSKLSHPLEDLSILEYKEFKGILVLLQTKFSIIFYY